MKKILQPITLVFMLSFLLTSVGMAQEIQLTHSGNGHPPAEYTTKDGGQWIKYWDTGVNDNALGLGGDGAQWFAAIRWMPEDLAAFEGYMVTTVRIFINDEPNDGAVTIWQGTLENPQVYVSQPMMVTEEDWVEVELFDPHLIDHTQELWIGWEIGDKGDGNFPAAFETSDAHDGKANLLQFGTNPWQFASAFGFQVAWNIEAYVVPIGEPDPTYTVTFDVKDEGGDDIDNASIVLGPFTGGPGEYVFEGAPAGTHEYTVTAPGYLTVTGEVEVVDEDVTVEVVMEEVEVVYHEVTFNVDMTGVEGFDHNEHEVYLTGTFTNWNEPGTGESLTMELVPPAAKDAPPYTFYENWSGYDDFVIDLSPWITLRLTEGDNWGASDFSYPPHEGTDFSWLSFNPALTDPAIDEEHPPIDGERYVVAVQYMDLDDDKWLISPEFSINETSELSFWGKSITAAYGLERIRVLVSTSGEDPGNFIPVSQEPYIEVPTDWTQFTFDLSDYAGEVIRFAINYVSHDAFIFMLDAILLHAETDEDPDPDPEELIYTVTTQVPEGEAKYKYFSDAFGAGWDGGEWAGDPDRVINVSGDMVVNDVWGEEPPPVSVVEVDMEDQFMKIFPNPASSILNIASDYQILNVAVYDITGRLLIQDNNDVVNVSNLRNGLYIIQVTTVAGTESHRFHVAR